jgi:N-acetylglucosamine-6-sulfatase
MKNRLLRILLIGWVTQSLSAVEPVPSSAIPERHSDRDPMNVVFILSDDHRYDAMGFLGHPLAVTPNMDRIANEGVHFENALVSTALCSPSRATIITGLYTFRHRVIDNNRMEPPGTLYFSQYLQNAGYATAFIGKWHMGGASDAPRPGFDHWVSFAGQGHYLPPHENYTLNVDGKRVPQKGYITDELTDYATQWLDDRKNSKQPFFLYLSHKAVHADFTPADRHAGSLSDIAIERPSTEASSQIPANDRPRWLRDQRNSWHGVDFPYHSALDIDQYYRAYCETLRGVDDSIGRVLNKLDEMGVMDNTVVIYMGDNGFMFGEHGLIDKRVAYEPSMRVPLLMYAPTITDQRTVKEMVANVDIAPTVLDLMGLQVPSYMDGKSFLGLATGQSDPLWRKDFVYCYYWEKNFPQSPTVFSLREDRYKYITYYGIWDKDELFDLQADPNESTNLIADPALAGIRQRMEDRLYERMNVLGGMQIPLNQPAGGFNNKRLRSRGGQEAADFPQSYIVDQPPNKKAH